MERFDADVSSTQTAFQEAPEVFDSVGMDATVHVLFGMIDDIVDVLLAQSAVRSIFIGDDVAAFLYVSKNVGMESFTVALCKHFGLDSTTALQHSHYDGFANSAALLESASNLSGFVHISRFPSNEGFIYFDLATQFRAEELILHRKPNPMQHKPRGLLGNPHISCDLIRTDAIFAVGDKPHGGEPLVQANRGIFHNGADLDGELAFRMVAGTLPSATVGIEFHFFGVASWTSDFAIRPATKGQIVNTVV